MLSKWVNVRRYNEGVPTAVAHVVGVGASKQHIMMALGWWWGSAG